MDKDLKKCYECLDLPITATEQDVQLRKKALVKIYETKAVEKGVSYDKQIGLIENSSASIIENLKNNGTPKDEHHYFESSWKSIGILSIALAFVAMICFFSFYIFF